MAIEKKGFTLVEMVVLMGVIAIVGVMISNLFLTNLRTAAKTKALTEVKQNGDYVLSVMERMIRNAREVSDYNALSITVINPDEGTTVFRCENDGDEKITSNSAALTSIKVRVSSDCEEFLSYQAPTGKPLVVKIKFTLSQKGASLGREFTAQVPFQTTVSTRIY